MSGEVPKWFWFMGLAVEVGGGGRQLDSNDWSAAVGEMPLWAALALHLSCRMGTSVLVRLAACLLPALALLGGLGGLCPLAGVGDLRWREGGEGWRVLR